MSEQQLSSAYQPLGPVVFPTYQGRQARYIAFDLNLPTLPPAYADYLPAVKQLAETAGAHYGTAYLTIDEKVVLAGMSQRRPRPHVDGCFVQIGDQMQWGGAGGGAWLHYCNDVGASPVGRMSVIVAATVAGCRAWQGKFTGRPAVDGDLSHISEQLGDGQVLAANHGYLLSPDCVHESMTFDQDTTRQFLRIALPVGSIEASVWD